MKALSVCEHGLCHIRKPRAAPFGSFHPTPGVKIRMQSAISNSIHESFHIQFPIKFTGTYHIPLFHFLMVCAEEIVSRTFLHALGIPSSLKSLFQARPLFWLLQHALSSPKSWPHSPLASAPPRTSRNYSDTSVPLESNVGPTLGSCGGELWQQVAGGLGGCRVQGQRGQWFQPHLHTTHKLQGPGRDHHDSWEPQCPHL